MEREIDLRPYILAILRRWKLIALVMTCFVAVAAGITAVTPPVPVASASVLLLAANSQPRFDERFPTESTSPFTNPATQREALIALASNTVIEEDVKANLPPVLANQNYRPGDLARRIRVSSTGDLLRLSASDTDPERAMALVQVWAENYVRLVNEVYGRDSALTKDIETQFGEAQSRYDAAQKELETFVGSNNQVQVTQQIKGIEALLDGSREGSQMLYTKYLSRTHELELVIGDAQTLRQQISLGQSNELANALVALTLRARAVGGEQLPLDLRLDNLGALQQGDEATMTDLERLITALQQRRAELLDQSQKLAQAIAAGGEGAVGLDPALRKQYEQELTSLKQQDEQIKARQKWLEQQRDKALELLAILQNKLDEQRVAQGTNQVEVRFINAAIEPPQSLVFRVVLNSAIAAILGLFIGVIVVIFVEVIRPRLRAMQSPAQAERPADRPITG